MTLKEEAIIIPATNKRMLKYNHYFNFYQKKYWILAVLVFPLFKEECFFTDDTVMTVAVADWLLNNGDLTETLRKYGQRYLDAGYGGGFANWLVKRKPRPYFSWGNGSAMRVSPVGWLFDSLEETLEKAKESAEVTDDHPEGIKGAQAIATCIFLARTGADKPTIKRYVESEF